MQRFVIAVALLLAFATPAPLLAAAPLADSVPNDALLYIGWRGASASTKNGKPIDGSAYAKSHLRAVAEASDLVPSLTKMMPQLIEKLGDNDPQAAAMTQLGYSIAGAAWKHPSAVYVAMDPVQPGAQRPPEPKVAVVIAAGADAAQVMEDLQPMLEGAPPEIRRMILGDGRVVVTNVPSGLLDQLIVKPGGDRALAGHKPFKGALAQTQADPYMAVYIDTEAILSRIEGMMAEGERQAAARGGQPPRDLVQTKQVMAALAPKELSRVMVTMGFAGTDWETAAFIESTGERTGLAKWIAGAPLGDDVLKVVPSTAAMVSAAAFDLNGTYQGLRKAVAEFDPNMSREVDQLIAEIEKEAGMKLGEDIFAAFGPQWAMYTDRHVATTSLMGAVVVNQLADADKAEAALWKLATIFNAKVSEGIGDPDFTVAIKQVKRKGATIHYLAIPAVAIAWAIDDGRLYLGLQPQSVAGAIDFARSEGDSILDNAEFVKARTAVRGVGAVSSFSYIDLPQKANDAYALNLLITRYITGFADMFGVDAPAFAIPPLTDLRPHLTTSMAANWTDEAGIHFRARSPFPMAEMLATEQNIGVMQLGLMAGIMMPALSNAREAAGKAASAANMKQLLVGCMAWSADHKGQMPPDLGTLLVEQYIDSPRAFIHPRSGNAMPPGLNKEQMKQWVAQSADYVFIAGGKKMGELNQNNIVIYERLRPNEFEGINIGFADGRVQWFDLESAVNILHQAKQPIPEDHKWLLDDGDDF